MGNNSESAKRSAHLRYHQRKGITRLDCSFCQEAKNLPPAIVELDPDFDPQQPIPRDPLPTQAQAITKPKEPFDSGRARSMAERARSLEHCALLFGLTPAQFKAELKAVDIDWNYLAETAPLQLLEDLERAIYAGARRGDPRFLMLLIRCRKLPGWNEDGVSFNSPSQDLRPAIEMQPTSVREDLRTLSTADLQLRLDELRRGQLEKVIDAPQRLQTGQYENYSIQDATIAEIIDFQTKQKSPLHLPDDDSDEKVKSSTFMTIDLN